MSAQLPTILSLTVYCPKGDTPHVAFYDRVDIQWKKRQIWIDCPSCNDLHIIPFPEESDG